LTSLLDVVRQEPKGAFKKATEAIKLAEQKGYPFWFATARVIQGWSEVFVSPTSDLVRDLETRVEAQRALGTNLFTPLFNTIMAEAAMRTNQVDISLAMLKDAESMIGTTGERWHESETYRLMGECFLVTGNLDEADAHLERAINIARQSEAKSFELRAVISLAQLCESQNQCQKARNILLSIVDWFSEDAESADIERARNLLSDLESRSEATAD
jgi:hypothetical protein